MRSLLHKMIYWSMVLPFCISLLIMAFILFLTFDILNKINQRFFPNEFNWVDKMEYHIFDCLLKGK